MTKCYAGIGSRETPGDVLVKMTTCARWLDRRGYVLRSGGAEGADKAFEKGSGDSKEIFRPSDEIPLWTNIFTDKFHPSHGLMKDYVRKLMNRNAVQILGKDGNSLVDFVVCYTKDGEFSGGTGQALRIANYFGVPIFNFYDENCGKDIRKFVEG